MHIYAATPATDWGGSKVGLVQIVYIFDPPSEKCAHRPFTFRKRMRITAFKVPMDFAYFRMLKVMASCTSTFVGLNHHFVGQRPTKFPEMGRNGGMYPVTIGFVPSGCQT